MRNSMLLTLMMVFTLITVPHFSGRMTAPMNEEALAANNDTTTENVSEQVSETDGMTIVYIPAGFFLMGSDSHRDAASEADERPQNKVFVGSFWIDKTEVTNSMYAHYLNEQESQGVKIFTEQEENGSLLSSENGWIAEPGQEDLPVTNVTWFEAQSYCEWAGRRLPTEAEWEKAARGEDGVLYPWGDESPDCSKAVFDTCADAPLNVGSLPAGQSYGVYDMAGNVWEWVSDYYDERYYKHHDEINPRGPDYEYYTMVLGEPLYGAVIKGGSWADGPENLRAANRVDHSRTEGFPLIGFRCAVSGVSGLIIQ